ncbi:MAG: hypothetical protein HY787_13260 [Deltaproteobacteria bacterium]|nr:hypothetical protein [Deltaproteobacteria bacterium]
MPEDKDYRLPDFSVCDFSAGLFFGLTHGGTFAPSAFPPAKNSGRAAVSPMGE